MNEIDKKFELITKGLDDYKHNCSKCKLETVHNTISQFSEQGHQLDDSYHYQWNTDYQIIQCKGCETISFCYIATDDQDIALDYNNKPYPVKTIKLFPTSYNNNLSPIDTSAIPPKVAAIYLETLNNHNNLQWEPSRGKCQSVTSCLAPC